MTLVGKLKALFKAAVRSGKIVYLGPKHKVQHDEDFTLFRKNWLLLNGNNLRRGSFFFANTLPQKKLTMEIFIVKVALNNCSG